MRFIDLTNSPPFGRLTVLERVENNKHNRIQWRCLCVCGNSIVVSSRDLKSGNTNSCGCLRRDTMAKIARKHSYAGTRIYNIWAGMHQRCLNPNAQRFQDYGGRGISVAPQWNDFSQFLRDVGQPPSPQHSLDRILNDGNYEPGNVRWALPIVQNNNARRNVRITYRGENHTVAQWERILGFPENRLGQRLRLGWSDERALSTPLQATQGAPRLPRGAPYESVRLGH